jgi:hypothetical protein
MEQSLFQHIHHRVVNNNRFCRLAARMATVTNHRRCHKPCRQCINALHTYSRTTVRAHQTNNCIGERSTRLPCHIIKKLFKVRAFAENAHLSHTGRIPKLSDGLKSMSLDCTDAVCAPPKPLTSKRLVGSPVRRDTAHLSPTQHLQPQHPTLGTMRGSASVDDSAVGGSSASPSVSSVRIHICTRILTECTARCIDSVTRSHVRVHNRL